MSVLQLSHLEVTDNLLLVLVLHDGDTPVKAEDWTNFSFLQSFINKSGKQNLTKIFVA